MGFQISKVFAGLFGKREMRILMVGLVRLNRFLSAYTASLFPDAAYTIHSSSFQAAPPVCGGSCWDRERGGRGRGRGLTWTMCLLLGLETNPQSCYYRTLPERPPSFTSSSWVRSLRPSPPSVSSSFNGHRYRRPFCPTTFLGTDIAV